MAKIPSWVAVESIESDELIFSELGEAPAETVEALELDAVSENNALSDIVRDGEDLSEDIDKVTELGDAVDAATAELSPTTSAVIDIAVESYCSKWGVRTSKIGFESRSADKGTAIVALEDAKQGLWARFAGFIKEMLNRVKDLWLKFSNAGKTIKRRGDKLAAIIKNNISDSAAVPSVELTGDWLKNCVIGDKIDIDAVISYGLEADQYTKANISCVGALVDSAGELFETADLSRIKNNNSMLNNPNLAKLFTKINISKLADIWMPASVSELNAEDVKCCPLPANAFLYSYRLGAVSSHKAGTSLETALPPIPYAVYITKELSKTKLVTKVADKATLLKAASAITAVGATMENDIKQYRSYDDKMKKLQDALSKTKENTRAVINSSDELEYKYAAAWKEKATRQQILNTSILIKATNSTRSNAVKGLMGYVSESINAYKAV